MPGKPSLLEVNAIFGSIRAGMPLPVKRWSILAFVLACFAFASSTAIAAAEWQVIRVNGHDYLSVDNISKFYGLPAEVVPSGAKIQSETADHPLEFVSGSREVIINGARSWLCFPLVEHEGKFLVSRTDVAKTIEPLVRPPKILTGACDDRRAASQGRRANQVSEG